MGNGVVEVILRLPQVEQIPVFTHVMQQVGTSGLRALVAIKSVDLRTCNI